MSGVWTWRSESGGFPGSSVPSTKPCPQVLLSGVCGLRGIQTLELSGTGFDGSCAPGPSRQLAFCTFWLLVHMLPCAPFPCPAWSWHMTYMERAGLHTQLEFQHRAKAEPSRLGPSCSNWRARRSHFPSILPHPSLSPICHLSWLPSSCFQGRDGSWMLVCSSFHLLSLLSTPA